MNMFEWETLGIMVAAAMVVGAASGGFAAEVKLLARQSLQQHDDFESEMKRQGGPQIVTGVVSGVVQARTRMAEYSAAKPCVIKSDTRFHTLRNNYLESSFRVYELGDGSELSFEICPQLKDRAPVIRAESVARGEIVEVSLCLDGRRLDGFSVSRSLMPFDLIVSLNGHGRLQALARSLLDSSVSGTVSDTGLFGERFAESCAVKWILSPTEGTKKARAVLDEYLLNTAVEPGIIDAPHRIAQLKEFDPVKAGWKKVFEDEFEGRALDWDKWYEPYYSIPGFTKADHENLAELDGEGHLRLKVVKGRGVGGRTPLDGGTIYTRRGFGYGYFEARLKFTEAPGWWSAFWTYGDANSNPFVDGFEIDGYEDFYTRRQEWRAKGEQIIVQNLHIRSGLGNSKSYSFAANLEPDFPGRWHDYGILHTPFEISIYLDGKLMKHYSIGSGESPDTYVTFDAFKSAACTAPNHAALSCCMMKSDPVRPWNDISKSIFPQYFEVDRVRVYEMPDPADKHLEVTFSKATLAASTCVPTGGVIRIEAQVVPSATGGKVKGVYLFDNGYFLQCRTDPPYVFEVPLTEEYLDRTAYMFISGYEGRKPPFNGLPHFFHVFAQDEEGNVGRTRDFIYRLPVHGKSTPYEGVAQRLPGMLNPVRFDEGGLPIGYYKHELAVKRPRRDLNPRPSRKFRRDDFVSCSESGDAIDFMVSGEWMNYTVDIAEAGEYEVAFDYGAPGTGINRLDILVDGLLAVAIPLESHDWTLRFNRDTRARAGLRLPAGRHELRLLAIGPVSFGSLEFVFKGVR